MDNCTSRFDRLINLLKVISCPACGRDGFDFEPETGPLSGKFSFTGSIICQRCSVRQKMEDGIIDLIPHGPRGLTLAQWSGQTQAVTWLYERIWRKRALGLLTGEPFPPEREFKILARCMKLPLETQDGIFLDLACSTGYYGRALADLLKGREAITQAGCVVGLDISMPMLKQARIFAREAGAEDYTFFIHADATNLPFADSSVVGIACGGSMNEYRDARRVIAEGARVLIPNDGRYFMMNLLEPRAQVSRFTRRTLTFGSGLKFFTREQMKLFFEAAGLRILWEEDFGLVAFTELAVMLKK